MPEEYDYIIAGAGSAGSVLAEGLSKDPRNRVLILEAGGKDDWIWYKIPVGYLFAIGNKRSDWCFRTQAEEGLAGRSLLYPRGKVIGGSSSINAMIYMRGQAADYDHWRQLGLSGWGWDDVLPIYKKQEDYYGGASEFHGGGGPLRVEEPRLTWKVLDEYRRAAEEVGIAAIADFNTGDNEGSAYFDVTQKKGTRFSAARAFLKPALSRPNLTIETGCLVDKVLVEDDAAREIVWIQNGQKRTARARREIVLAGGSIGSVQILLRSGIGPGHELNELGVPVIKDRPGVGKNLQDHLQLRMIYKVEGVKTLNETYWNLFQRAWMGVDYALRRRGPLTMAPSQLGIFTRSSDEVDRADLEFHVQPLSLDKFGDPLHRFPAITTSVCNLRPTSRGEVRLASAEADADPIIRPNYLSTDSDKLVAARSLRVARRITNSPGFRKFNPQEYLPGPSVGDTDEELAKAAGQIGTTIFHPVGTARMGLESDPNAVVDERLRVLGLRGLRVADASVMPSITSGNTNAPSMMIAGKAVQMILEDSAR
jgi:choline dehydrogenase